MVNAVFTLLYNGNYLPGALVLGKVVKKLITRDEDIPTLGVLVDESSLTPIQLALLEKTYDEVVFIKPLESKLTSILENELGRPELSPTFSKILLWSLLAYDKILYLDADTLPLENLSGSVLDLLKVDFPENKIMAAPDSGFPDVFNSGVFVLRPNLDDYNELATLVTSTQQGVSFDGADQGLLNQYFNENPDWVGKLLLASQHDVSQASTEAPSNWIRLPFFYNVTPSSSYQYGPALEHFSTAEKAAIQPQASVASSSGIPLANVSSAIASASYYSTAFDNANSNSRLRLIHFIGPHKPWQGRATTGAHKQWWDAFDYHFSSQPSVSDQTEISTNVPKELSYPSRHRTDRYIGPSIHTAWDPSAQSPPNTRPTHSDAIFANSLANYGNSWSQNDASHNQRARNLPHTGGTATHIDTVSDSLAPYSYSKSSAHNTANRAFANNPLPYSSTAPTHADLAQINSRLKSLATSPGSSRSPVGPLSSSHFTSHHSTSDAPKIFPWEHKEDALPAERQFDS